MVYIRYIYMVHIYCTYIRYFIPSVLTTIMYYLPIEVHSEFYQIIKLELSQVVVYSLMLLNVFAKKNPSQGPESTSGGSRVKCSSAKKQMCSFQNKVISYFRLFHKLYNWFIIHISTHRKHDSHWSSKKFQQF